MFGIGPFEIIVIVVGALLFIGPQRLPTAMKQLGKFFVKARSASTEIRSGFDHIMKEAEKEVQLEKLAEHKKSIEDKISEMADDPDLKMPNELAEDFKPLHSLSATNNGSETSARPHATFEDSNEVE